MKLYLRGRRSSLLARSARRDEARERVPPWVVGSASLSPRPVRRRCRLRFRPGELRRWPLPGSGRDEACTSRDRRDTPSVPGLARMIQVRIAAGSLWETLRYAQEPCATAVPVLLLRHQGYLQPPASDRAHAAGVFAPAPYFAWRPRSRALLLPRSSRVLGWKSPAVRIRRLAVVAGPGSRPEHATAANTSWVSRRRPVALSPSASGRASIGRLRPSSPRPPRR